ncbi:hypothetical protein LAZ67_5004134 [Cordylochernes scorpioides]|uniref:SPIN-DOC-like zinc-finger domain-containing protein n=1 Tax=Cordylochernes scorpioides TaxID=51811 RepID=A0ABY6KLA8_9ARAC|nr:hypothetical protein LAZ67_5004134 [Cordylochernes scorpioides]
MLFLHQASYIERTLEHYNLLEIKLQSVPSDPYSKLTKEMWPKDNQEIEEISKIPYRQTIGSLMYLMTGTRPDIAYAVSRVSQFMNNPGPSHWTAVKKIFGYLKTTKNIGICFGGSSCTTSLIGFSDADFAGDLDTRKSTTGYVFMLNNGPISWCSQKQNCVSLSTTESEYIAASKATKEAIWLRQLLRELHQEQVKPTTIFCDNQSCIRLVHNPEYHKRTKHIDISYHFIRDQFQKHAIDLLYVCSNDQAADIFTKALPPERFFEMFTSILLEVPVPTEHLEGINSFFHGFGKSHIYTYREPLHYKETFVFNMSSSKPSGSKTKRKIADEHRDFQEKWELEYFCSEVKDKIICLICNNAISVPKLYNIKRHYEQHKSKYDTYEGLMRQEKLKEFKLGMKKQQFMFTKVSQESEAAVHASYVLSEMIAKHSKPFTEGDFIKECLIKAAEIICPGSVKTFQALSLSRNTVVERVTDMARNLNDQIKEKSSCFEAFSIACDESTDIGGVAQLAVLFFFELATRISTFLRNYWN